MENRVGRVNIAVGLSVEDEIRLHVQEAFAS